MERICKVTFMASRDVLSRNLAEMMEVTQEIICHDNWFFGHRSRTFQIWSLSAVNLTSTLTYNSDNTRFVLTDCTTSPFLHTRSLIQGPAAPPLSWLLANPNPRVIRPSEQTTILLSVDANILARSLAHRCGDIIDETWKTFLVPWLQQWRVCALCAVRWIHGLLKKKLHIAFRELHCST